MHTNTCIHTCTHTGSAFIGESQRAPPLRSATSEAPPERRWDHSARGRQHRKRSPAARSLWDAWEAARVGGETGETGFGPMGRKNGGLSAGQAWPCSWGQDWAATPGLCGRTRREFPGPKGGGGTRSDFCPSPNCPAMQISLPPPWGQIAVPHNRLSPSGENQQAWPPRTGPSATPAPQGTQFPSARWEPAEGFGTLGWPKEPQPATERGWPSWLHHEPGLSEGPLGRGEGSWGGPQLGGWAGWRRQSRSPRATHIEPRKQAAGRPEPRGQMEGEHGLEPWGRQHVPPALVDDRPPVTRQ